MLCIGIERMNDKHRSPPDLPSPGVDVLQEVTIQPATLTLICILSFTKAAVGGGEDIEHDAELPTVKPLSRTGDPNAARAARGAWANRVSTRCVVRVVRSRCSLCVQI